MKKKTLARQTAELIAADLFSYTGIKGRVKVARLVVEVDEFHGPLVGVGWCEGAVADRIEEILLRKHLTHWIEKKTKKG